MGRRPNKRASRHGTVTVEDDDSDEEETPITVIQVHQERSHGRLKASRYTINTSDDFDIPVDATMDDNFSDDDDPPIPHLNDPPDPPLLPLEPPPGRRVVVNPEYTADFDWDQEILVDAFEPYDPWTRLQHHNYENQEVGEGHRRPEGVARQGNASKNAPKVSNRLPCTPKYD